MELVKWIRFAVGFVFITSGSVKLLVPSFKEVFTNLGLPLPEIFLFILAIVEICCGAVVVVNMFVKQATMILTMIMIGALAIAKLPVLFHEGLPLFIFESRLDVTMLLLLFVLWRHQNIEGVQSK